MASAIVDITWFSILLCDLIVPLSKTPILQCDNISALYLSISLIWHARTKYIKVDYHYIRSRFALGTILTQYVTYQQLANIFTKRLLKVPFRKLRLKLGLCSSHDQVWRGVLGKKLKNLHKKIITMLSRIIRILSCLKMLSYRNEKNILSIQILYLLHFCTPYIWMENTSLILTWEK